MAQTACQNLSTPLSRTARRRPAKTIKINLKELACFSAPQNAPSTHHVSPRNNHNFTTKTPHRKRGFFQNPLQKHSQNRNNPPTPQPDLFSKKI
jgi:hypothetical protein